jgi:hypothetical protein
MCEFFFVEKIFKFGRFFSRISYLFACNIQDSSPLTSLKKKLKKNSLSFFVRSF